MVSNEIFLWKVSVVKRLFMDYALMKKKEKRAYFERKILFTYPCRILNCEFRHFIVFNYLCEKKYLCCIVNRELCHSILFNYRFFFQLYFAGQS